MSKETLEEEDKWTQEDVQKKSKIIIIISKIINVQVYLDLVLEVVSTDIYLYYPSRHNQEDESASNSNT